MRKTRSLKPQDIAVLGKLITDKGWPTQKEIAVTFNLSQAEISHALRTLEFVGLINLKMKKINKIAIEEFLVYAIKYIFPSQKEGVGRGFLIGPSSSFFRKKIESDGWDYIWPDAEGDAKGVIIKPLVSWPIGHNEKLITFFNIVEILRGLGGVRHQQEAKRYLKVLLDGKKS